MNSDDMQYMKKNAQEMDSDGNNRTEHIIYYEYKPALFSRSQDARSKGGVRENFVAFAISATSDIKSKPSLSKISQDVCQYWRKKN